MTAEIEIPTGAFVPVLFSTDLLRDLAVSDGPIRLISLSGPDDEGFYTPAFMVIYPPEPDRRPWWKRVFG